MINPLRLRLSGVCLMVLPLMLLTACQQSGNDIEFSALPTLTSPTELNRLEPGNYDIGLNWVQQDGAASLEARGDAPPDEDNALTITISYHVVPLNEDATLSGEERQQIDASDQQLSDDPQNQTTCEFNADTAESDGTAELQPTDEAGETDDVASESALTCVFNLTTSSPNYAVVYRMMSVVSRNVDNIILNTRGKIIVNGDMAYKLN